jgi:ankyrin repeat protein
MLASQSQCGFAEGVRMLLDKGADPDIDGGFGRPLHAAVLENRMDVTMLLARAGANPFLKNEHGHTPRELAVLRGKTALVPLLEEAENNYVNKKSPAGKITAPKMT